MRYVENLVSVEGGYGRTGSRSPMQWNKGLNAGFSSACKEKLYIPQDESEDRPNAESQSADICSLRSEVKRLIAFRQNTPPCKAEAASPFCKTAVLLSMSGHPAVSASGW